MVTQFGMTDRFGPVSLESSEDGSGTGGWTFLERGYSDETAGQIDAEIRRIVSEAYERARSLLERHRDVLRELASALMDQEVMEGRELKRILKERGITREPAGGPDGHSDRSPSDG
jgi:cell division protease FtsH